MNHANRNNPTECKDANCAPEILNTIPDLPLMTVVDHRFVAIIDHAIVISEDAARRIDTRLKQAVLAEIAELHLDGEIVITFATIEGGREMCVRRVRN